MDMKIAQDPEWFLSLLSDAKKFADRILSEVFQCGYCFV